MDFLAHNSDIEDDDDDYYAGDDDDVGIFVPNENRQPWYRRASVIDELSDDYKYTNRIACNVRMDLLIMKENNSFLAATIVNGKMRTTHSSRNGTIQFQNSNDSNIEILW